jgi:hypothetical protein
VSYQLHCTADRLSTTQPVAPPKATHLKLRGVPAPESGVLAKRERRHVTQAREINGRDHRRGRAGAGGRRALER